MTFKFEADPDMRHGKKADTDYVPALDEVQRARSGADKVPVPGLRVGPLLAKKVDGPLNCGIKQLCEYKCMVLPDEVEEVTSGGIVKAPGARRVEQLRTCKATFIMRSENAFRDWGGYIPEPGDRVYVSVSSGMLHEGPDGREYRIVNDKDVVGQLDE